MIELFTTKDYLKIGNNTPTFTQPYSFSEKTKLIGLYGMSDSNGIFRMGTYISSCTPFDYNIANINPNALKDKV